MADENLAPTRYVVKIPIGGDILPEGAEFGPEVYSEEQIAGLLERGIIEVKDGTMPPPFMSTQEFKDALAQDALDSIPPPVEQAPSTSDSAWLDSVAGLNDSQREALAEAGYDSPEAITAATDEELDSVDRIGPSAVEALRKATG